MHRTMGVLLPAILEISPYYVIVDIGEEFSGNFLCSMCFRVRLPRKDYISSLLQNDCSSIWPVAS
jgi:hypothetical protein